MSSPKISTTNSMYKVHLLILVQTICRLYFLEYFLSFHLKHLLHVQATNSFLWRKLFVIVNYSS